MWRPPQKIVWKPRAGEWPTRERARSSPLFAPARIGPLSIAARTWVPAMVPWRATDDGFVTDDNVDWYERFARGRPGVLVVEATGVRDMPSGPLLRIGDDRFVPGLRRIVDAVRSASGGETKLFIQLIDFLSIRRRPDPERFLRRHLEIREAHRAAVGFPAGSDARDDDVRERLLALAPEALARVLDEREREALRMGARERITDLHLPHVRELPRVLPGLFADAARRACAAGFDGVELHYAHAYTMASFLSAKNDRDDGYGRTRAGRVRLPLEVLRAVRAAIGDRIAVGCRYLAEECIDGGSTVDDAVHFGVAFAREGIDFLSASRGGKFEDARQPAVGAAAYPYTGPSGYECMPHRTSDERGPYGRNVEPSAAVRVAVRAAGFDTPVVVTGGVHGFEQAERLLVDGQADFVGFARQSLADPDWFTKVRAGRGTEVRVCEYTNYCEALDQKHEQVTCKLWDRTGLEEPGLKRTTDGKRRLVAPPWGGER
ncbi:MAG TPA: hypothetical protein VGE10_00385 [Zeimonas sp.]